MLTVEQLTRLKNQIARIEPRYLTAEIGLDLDLNNREIVDDLIRGLDLLILHRKGIME